MNDELIYAVIIGMILGGVFVSVLNQGNIEDAYITGRLHTYQTLNVTVIENTTLVDVPITIVCQNLINNLNTNQGGK